MTNNAMIMIFQSSLVVGYYMLMVEGRVMVQEKAEASSGTISSPREGNMTFLDNGTTWCVALPGASQFDLQNALDWTCGLGMADCAQIQSGGRCYHPDTLLSHASFAFNTYYQQNGNSDVACNFGGTAILTKNDPSYGKCVYPASRSVNSNAVPLSKYLSLFVRWHLIGILLFLCWGQ